MWTQALLWVIDHLCPMWTAVAPWVEYKEQTFYQYTMLAETQAEQDGQDRIRRVQGFDTRIRAAQQEVEAAQESLRQAEERAKAEEERRKAVADQVGILAGIVETPKRTVVAQPRGGMFMDGPAARGQSLSVAFSPKVTSTERKVRKIEVMGRI